MPDDGGFERLQRPLLRPEHDDLALGPAKLVRHLGCRRRPGRAAAVRFVHREQTRRYGVISTGLRAAGLRRVGAGCAIPRWSRGTAGTYVGVAAQSRGSGGHVTWAVAGAPGCRQPGAPATVSISSGPAATVISTSVACACRTLDSDSRRTAIIWLATAGQPTGLDSGDGRGKNCPACCGHISGGKGCIAARAV